MSNVHERGQILVHLDEIERGLKALLTALEAKHAPAESLDKALATLEGLKFDAEATVRAFEGASRVESKLVKQRLMHLADLEAIARTECQRMLATTTLAIERAQVLKERLDTLRETSEPGDSIDCVR